ncbi:Domain of uncharacterised function (DUF2825) [Salmonella enterica subsp. enterica serovar Stanley]|nr:Domain of uncharacterised function (DUF2825) [Salmonella enterica subsp. enterica serovar Stanley]SUH50857.1 Domain of uncharacterised function (DUF2825) [Salmonella enterica subsp. enterica]
MAVYPRWRGEHTATDATASAIPGLSPLARGTPSLPLRIFEGFRFIPAGAGNTRYVSLTCQNSTVYPRWRGEHLSG